MIRIISRYTGSNSDYIKNNDTETELEFIVDEPVEFVITGEVTAYLSNKKVKLLPITGIKHTLNSFFVSIPEEVYKTLGLGLVEIKFSMEDKECNYKEVTDSTTFTIEQSLSDLEVVGEDYKRPTESQEEIEERKKRRDEISKETEGLLNGGYNIR
jgi:hypothetical protein